MYKIDSFLRTIEALTMTKKYKGEIVEELRGATTIDFICKSENVVEKVLWITIATIGTIWAFYFIGLQIISWSQNPLIITKHNMEVDELLNPAITVCSKGSTKYAIAERLGNYLDPESDLPKVLKALKEQLLLCILLPKDQNEDAKNDYDWNNGLLFGDCSADKTKRGCEVNMPCILSYYNLLPHIFVCEHF